jgi:hypothetical protein
MTKKISAENLVRMQLGLPPLKDDKEAKENEKVEEEYSRYKKKVRQLSEKK